LKYAYLYVSLFHSISVMVGVYICLSRVAYQVTRTSSDTSIHQSQLHRMAFTKYCFWCSITEV